MTFVRRSRKGRIHVVRGRIAGGYMRLSKGLMRANQSVIGGVRQTHKGLQLGLAKGHQAIQSGLKGVQNITGDFNMYQRNSYYQYQEPVAMFNMGDVKYQDGNQVAIFAKEARGGAWWKRGQENTQKQLPGSGKTSAGTSKARWQRASGDAGRAFKSVGTGIGNAAKGVASGVAGGVRGLGNVAGKPFDAAGRRLGEMAYKNPKLAGLAVAGGLLAAGATGAGGATFMRRRRSKNGKMIVENVRR